MARTKATPVDDLFERCWKAYNRKGSKKCSHEQWDKLTADMRKMAEKHIPFYVASRDFIYCKDFERYLRDRVFECPVRTRDGETLFDPDEETAKKKTPVLNGFQG